MAKRTTAREQCTTETRSAGLQFLPRIDATSLLSLLLVIAATAALPPRARLALLGSELLFAASSAVRYRRHNAAPSPPSAPTARHATTTQPTSRKRLATLCTTRRQSNAIIQQSPQQHRSHGQNHQIPQTQIRIHHQALTQINQAAVAHGSNGRRLPMLWVRRGCKRPLSNSNPTQPGSDAATCSHASVRGFKRMWFAWPRTTRTQNNVYKQPPQYQSEMQLMHGELPNDSYMEADGKVSYTGTPLVAFLDVDRQMDTAARAEMLASRLLDQTEGHVQLLQGGHLLAQWFNGLAGPHQLHLTHVMQLLAYLLLPPPTSPSSHVSKTLPQLPFPSPVPPSPQSMTVLPGSPCVNRSIDHHEKYGGCFPSQADEPSTMMPGGVTHGSIVAAALAPRQPDIEALAWRLMEILEVPVAAEESHEAAATLTNGSPPAIDVRTGPSSGGGGGASRLGTAVYVCDSRTPTRHSPSGGGQSGVDTDLDLELQQHGDCGRTDMAAAAASSIRTSNHGNGVAIDAAAVMMTAAVDATATAAAATREGRQAEELAVGHSDRVVGDVSGEVGVAAAEAAAVVVDSCARAAVGGNEGASASSAHADTTTQINSADAAGGPARRSLGGFLAAIRGRRSSCDSAATPSRIHHPVRSCATSPATIPLIVGLDATGPRSNRTPEPAPVVRLLAASTDPLVTSYRPLAFYMLTEAVAGATHLVLLGLIGFRVAGVTPAGTATVYEWRPRLVRRRRPAAAAAPSAHSPTTDTPATRGTSTSATSPSSVGEDQFNATLAHDAELNPDFDADPVVFLHGIGLGLTPYLRLLGRLVEAGGRQRRVFAVQYKHVSMRLTATIPAPQEVARDVAAFLASRGVRRMSLCAHSYGTLVASALTKLAAACPRAPAVSRLTLVDPVCFAMFLPHLVRNAIYQQPVPAPHQQHHQQHHHHQPLGAESDMRPEGQQRNQEPATEPSDATAAAPGPTRPQPPLGSTMATYAGTSAATYWRRRTVGTTAPSAVRIVGGDGGGGNGGCAWRWRLVGPGRRLEGAEPPAGRELSAAAGLLPGAGGGGCGHPGISSGVVEGGSGGVEGSDKQSNGKLDGKNDNHHRHQHPHPHSQHSQHQGGTTESFGPKAGPGARLRHVLSRHLLRGLVVAEFHCSVALRRRLDWAAVNLWPSELPPDTTVLLAGRDNLVPVREVRSILATRAALLGPSDRHPTVLFHEDLGHGGFLAHTPVQDQVLAAVLGVSEEAVRTALAAEAEAVCGSSRAAGGAPRGSRDAAAAAASEDGGGSGESGDGGPLTAVRWEGPAAAAVAVRRRVGSEELGNEGRQGDGDGDGDEVGFGDDEDGDGVGDGVTVAGGCEGNDAGGEDGGSDVERDSQGCTASASTSADDVFSGGGWHHVVRFRRHRRRRSGGGEDEERQGANAGELSEGPVVAAPPPVLAQSPQHPKLPLPLPLLAVDSGGGGGGGGDAARSLPRWRPAGVLRQSPTSPLRRLIRGIRGL